MTRDHVKLALAVCAIIAFWAAVLYLSASHSEDVAEFRKKEKECIISCVKQGHEIGILKEGSCFCADLLEKK